MEKHEKDDHLDIEWIWAMVEKIAEAEDVDLMEKALESHPEIFEEIERNIVEAGFDQDEEEWEMFCEKKDL